MYISKIFLTLLIALPLGLIAAATAYANAQPQTDVSKATTPSSTSSTTNNPAVGWNPFDWF